MALTLTHLLARNVAWARSKVEKQPDYFRAMAEEQRPKYLWIGCSDSRVTANDVLGLEPGEVFVHRNVGNMVHTSDLNVLSVLEFAIDQLNVQHVIVCGHYGCGGVQRAMSGARGTLSDHWLQPLSMLHRKHRCRLEALGDERWQFDRMCEVNVGMQVRRLAATPIVEDAWARGAELHLHGWVYAVHDGLLRDIGPHLSSAVERDALPSIDDDAAIEGEPAAGP